MRFANRAEAGRLLAIKLEVNKSKAVIFALPRGGVALGAAIAQVLNTPLGLVIACKIGHPLNPEYAVGAVTETGPVVWNEAERSHLDDTWAKHAETAARSEALRRRKKYQAGRKSISATGKTAIVVDDGVATGLTMRAAIQAVHDQKPARLIVATPCAPADTISYLMECSDEVIVLTDPEDYLGAVGLYYENFPQLSDEDVIALLEEIR